MSLHSLINTFKDYHKHVSLTLTRLTRITSLSNVFQSLRRKNTRRVFEPIAYGWVIRVNGLTRVQRNAMKKSVPGFAIDETKGELLMSIPVAEINVPHDLILHECLGDELPPMCLLTTYLKHLVDLRFNIVSTAPVANKFGIMTEFLWTLQIQTDSMSAK